MINKIFGIMIAVLVCIAAYFSTKQTKHYRQQAKTLEETISNLDQQIKISKIQLHDSIMLYQAEINDVQIIKANLQAKYDKLLKASSLKPKDVNSITEIASVIQGMDTVIAEVDTFNGLKAKLSDQFVNIKVYIPPDRKTIIDYRIYDSLTIINVQKRHSILFGLIKWKKHKSIRVINHNPKAEIISLQTMDIIE